MGIFDQEVRNEWILAYREGNFAEIPNHMFKAVVDREALNDAPKPDESLVEEHLAKIAKEGV